jgi:hypothetical protein
MINLKTVKNIKASASAVLFLLLLAFAPQVSLGQENEVLNGETKIEDPKTSVENILMGNISAGRAADKIAAAIRAFDPGIKSIVIYDKEQAEMLAGYEKTRRQLETLSSRYNALISKQENIVKNLSRQDCTEDRVKGLDKDIETHTLTDGFKGGLDLAGETVGSFVKLLSYFRTNVELRPEVFDIEDRVVIAEVFRALRQQYGSRIKLYNPNSIPPRFSESELIKLIETVINLDETASNNDDRLNEELPRVICLAAKNAADLSRKRELERAVADYEKNNRQLAAIISGLTGEVSEEKTKNNADDNEDEETTPAQSKPNYLTAYLAVEKIYRAMRENNNGYWLEINAVKAGGTTRVKTNLIVDVFTGGDRVSHSGASLIQYNLYDNTGVSALSGIVPDYIPYTKPKIIPALVKSVEERLAQSPKKVENEQVTKNTLQNGSIKKNQ